MTTQRAVTQKSGVDHFYIVKATDLDAAGGQAALDAAYPANHTRSQSVQNTLAAQEFAGYVRGITPSVQRNRQTATAVNAETQQPQYGAPTITRTITLAPPRSATGRADDYEVFFDDGKDIPSDAQFVVGYEWGGRRSTDDGGPTNPLKQPSNAYSAGIYTISEMDGMNRGPEGVWGNWTVTFETDGLAPKRAG